MAKVVQAPPDLLLSLSQYYWDRCRCACCRQELNVAGAVRWCSGCGAAAYCGDACLRRHAQEHRGHCHLTRELANVLSIDFDR